MNTTQYDIVKTFLPFGGPLKLATTFKISVTEVRRVERSNNYEQYLDSPKTDPMDDFMKMFGGTI